MRTLNGTVSVVTGSTSGIGRGIAEHFASLGSTVVVHGIDPAGGVETVSRVNAAGRDAAYFDGDLTSEGVCRDLIRFAVERFGGLDILVNNAGVSRPAPINDEGYEEAWSLTLDVNLAGHVRLIRACLPHLTRHGEGRIVNIASTEGLGATAGLSPYTASKHGVIGLTRALAVELGRHGVTVNCVCPGPIRTGMTAPIPEDAKTKFAHRRVPLRRYGDPIEVAHGTLSLVLPAASYINGAVLVIDGGMTAQNT